MKKVIRGILGVMLSASLVFSPVMEAAASNQFNVETEDVTGKLLFPGDSVYGIEPIYMGPDGAAQEVTDGTWTNYTAQAYQMGSLEGEEEGLWLQPMGYVLTVKGGTSRQAYTEGEEQYNHYQKKEDTFEEEEVSKDIAYFEAWTEVTVTADEPKEGQTFDHWEVEDNKITLEDASASEITFTMIDAAVTLTAVYKDAEEESPETEAPAEVPVSEVPTEVPVSEAAVTEEPVPEETIPDTGEVIPTETVPETGEVQPDTIENGTATEEYTWNETEANGIIVIGEDNTTEDNVVPEETERTLYTLTVENGSGSGEYELGTEVKITADTVEGMSFDGWTTEADTVWFSDSTDPETTFSMPAEDVTVTASYKENEVLTEEPETLEAYQESENEVLPEEPETLEAYQESENEVLPEEPETLEAYEENKAAETEEDIPVIAAEFYNVEVVDGQGSGNYEAGEQVTVYADEAPEGKVFAGWIASENVTLEDAYSEETSFMMPAEEVKLTATYVETESESETETEEEIIIQEESAETQSEAAGENQFSSESETGETQAPSESETTVETQAPSESETTVETQAPSESETTVETQAPSESETTVETQAPSESETTVETQPSSESETTGESQNPTESEATSEHQAETEEAKSYQIDLSDEAITVSGATLENGQLLAKAGDVVKITAEEYEDRLFQEWKITRSDTKETVAVIGDEEDYLTATFVMPESTVYVEAVYTVLQKNEVQVVDGSGSGTYLEGDYVEIKANKAPEGQRFKKWMVITGGVELEDSTSEVTGFTMPDEAVQVKAVYEVIKYTLTVNNGSGSGSYAVGETVSLTANYPASGKEFAEWRVTSENASVSAADRYYSSITMPAANVTVEATYKDGPSPDYNEIQNIVPGGEYLKGQTINFTAVGNGMANTNPNPGDYRYRPTGYQIGSVSGNWNNSPYTTSMAINAVGQYTLTVYYSKDVFDGNSWVADGTTVTKSVTFNVVNALSVQTGDSSPIIPLVIAAVVALAVIVILLIVRKRRK